MAPLPDGSGGTRTDAGGQAVGKWENTQYLSVYEESFTDTEGSWKTSGKLKRNAGTGTNIPGEEFVGWQAANQDGTYTNYPAASPVYGKNPYGSFYKLLSDETDHAAVTAYWAAYDAAAAKGSTAAEARVAGANAAMAILNDPVNGTITNDLKKGVDMIRSYPAGKNNTAAGQNGALGRYVSWQTTGSTLWYTLYYAQATKREDALVYVHVYDYFGNHYTNVLVRDFQDYVRPTMTATVGAVTVTEAGGSGISSMKVTNYSMGGSAMTLPALGGSINNVFSSETNTFTITDLTPGKIYSVYAEDRTTMNVTTDVKADANGTITITVVDTDNMDTLTNDEPQNNGAASPLTTMQIADVGAALLAEDTIYDVGDPAPAPAAADPNVYSFTLNDTYTVNLFAAEGRDYDVKLQATEGGMIKAYLDGEFAPVKSGKITVPGGSDLQIRVATKSGYTLESLVMSYADGTQVELLGSYTAEILDNVTIRATFAKADAMLTVRVENGTVNGQSEIAVYPNSRVTAAAAAAPEGKQFAYWSANGKAVSYEPVYTFNGTADIDLAAVYSDGAVEKTAAIVLDAASDAHVTQVNGKYSLAYSGYVLLPEGAEIEEFGLLLTDKTADACTAETFVLGADGTARLAGTTLTEQGQLQINVNNVKAGAARTGRLYLTVKLADGTTQTVYSDTWNQLTTPAA